MSEQPPPPTNEIRRILAVDDEEEIRSLYNTFLKFNGFEVTAVKSADECIEFLIQNVVDIILLDVNMPGMDGLMLLEMIRAETKSKNTPIIMISARGDEATVKKAAVLGCDNFIVKPFALTDLAERINSELFRLSTDQVRVLLEKARTIRTRLTREPGLQEFRAIEWDPYSFQLKDIEVCLMIQRGVRPASLARIPELELQKRVVVFSKHQVRWKRIWPAMSIAVAAS